MRTVGGVVCVIIALVAFAVAMPGFAELFSGAANGGTYGALVFLLGTGSAASYGAFRALRSGSPPAAPPAADATRVILALAAQEGGRVTLAEVVAKTPLGLEQAREALDELSRRNMASSIVTEDGVELFQIKGLLGPAQKLAARDILES
jgi:hypothetical protein